MTEPLKVNGRQEDPEPHPQAVNRLVDEAVAKVVSELMAQFKAKAKLSWDVRGLLALLTVVGTFALALTSRLTGGTADIPNWAAGLVSAVSLTYFIQKQNGGKS